MSTLTREEFDLLVSQVVVPRTTWARPLTERQVRTVGNNSAWENALEEVAQVTRDAYLHHIRNWWTIRDANNAKALTRCPEDTNTHACPPGLDGSLCEFHQEWADEEEQDAA